MSKRSKEPLVKQALRRSNQEINYWPLDGAVEYFGNPHLMAFNLFAVPIRGDPKDYCGDVYYVFIHNLVTGKSLEEMITFFSGYLVATFEVISVPTRPPPMTRIVSEFLMTLASAFIWRYR